MHRIDRKKVIIGFGILIVVLLLWPLVIATFVVLPKLEIQKAEFASRGMELSIQEKEGYFNSHREYLLSVNDKDKFIAFLSEIVKVDRLLLESILIENDDVLGLQFGGDISTKIWKPWTISVYIEPKAFPKNQIKLNEYKDILTKFGASFLFNLRGKLKEVDLNDIDLKTEQTGTNLILNFVKPIMKLGEVNKFMLEKYLIKTTQEDKNVELNSNNVLYNFQYKDDYNFKLSSTADDLLYSTQFNISNPDDYTIYLAKKISEEATECKNIRCIKTIANDILENEKHINSFEIYLDTRIIDGIRYSNVGNKIYEVRHKDGDKNLEYRLTYTKDNFKLPNVKLKTAKNSSNIEVISDGNEFSMITNTKIDDFSLSTSQMNIKAKTAQINGGLHGIKLEPIKYIMDNTDQFSSWEIDGYSPLLKHVIEIANYGGSMKYGMEFSELHYSKLKFPVKTLKIDADFVLKENKYNILHKPDELLKYITFDVNVKVDRDSFDQYLKSPMNEYKNLGKVAKYDGDYTLLDINFNLKDDVILVNNKELIK